MIPLAVPNLTGKENEYVAQAIANNHIGPSGPFVERFEEMVAKASGRKWAIAVLSGTSALEASATILGFAGKKVEVPPTAFPAMRNVLTRLGCEIVDDYDLDDGNHDCYYYSYQRLWPWLADRAPAIGESIGAGCAIIDCYSFAANKIVTCGMGGAICCDDSDLAEAIIFLIRQRYDRDGIFNYRMADINAAIGCAQMERLDELKEAKRRIWNRYAEHFDMIDRGPSRWMATVNLPHSLADYLREQDIECRPEPSGGVSLPCSTILSSEQQEKVIKAVESWLSLRDEPTQRLSRRSWRPSATWND